MVCVPDRGPVPSDSQAPRSSPAGGAGAHPMSDDRQPMTREGYDKKKAQLDRMKTVEMIEITKRVAAAREQGDLSENAEYHAAREIQGQLQARINQLEHELARANIIDPNSVATNGTVVF